MKKPRVLFPFTEAGYGHIIPMEAIADKFEELYGDKVEIVRSAFFTESGNKNLKAFEERLCDSVVKSNVDPEFGFFLTRNMDLFGPKIDSWATMRFLKVGAFKSACAYMQSLAPDMVVSTHWATNYYARHLKRKPLTAMYCPDVEMNPLFCYDCDLALVPTQSGYEKARKKYKKRFNEHNLKQVPYVIREKAFSVPRDKALLRRTLGIDAERFCVLLVEGGYGIGSIGEIGREILKRDLPVTLVIVCGKNEELLEQLKSIENKGRTQLRLLGYTDEIFSYLSASDLFCGKSGAGVIAEACYFGVPQIITHYATNIEQRIGEYYINNVGSALKIFDSGKVVDQIEEFLADCAKIEPYRLAAEARRGSYGAEGSAHRLYELLLTRFPELKRE